VVVPFLDFGVPVAKGDATGSIVIAGRRVHPDIFLGDVADDVAVIILISMAGAGGKRCLPPVRGTQPKLQ
jgi:hypothetical protein